MLTWPNKDSTEKLDYAVDWSRRLKSDETIESANAFSVLSGGVTITSQFNSDKISVAWIEGGTVGQTAKLRCTVTTSADRTFSEVVSLPIVNRAA
jgi:hypothetical protein